MSTANAQTIAPAIRHPHLRRGSLACATGAVLAPCILAIALGLSTEPVLADIRTDSLKGPTRHRDASARPDQPADAEALYRQALAHDLGDGVAQDYEKAFSLYREAAVRGHARAMLSVGLMLSQGHGIRADEVEAVQWMRGAAERGLADGQYSVGVVYMQGQGVEQDYVQARRWFELAAANRHPEAMNNLGVLHANGLGTPKDHVRSYAWFRLAEDAGSRDGQTNRIITERELAPSDVAAGTVLADELRARFRRD